LTMVELSPTLTSPNVFILLSPFRFLSNAVD
jgi:hypothetical protein